jgi:hypothetical protein
MKIIIRLCTVRSVFIILCFCTSFLTLAFSNSTSAQTNNPPKVVRDTITGLYTTADYIRSTNGTVLAIAYHFYIKNIGGTGLLDAHIKVGEFILDREFMFRSNSKDTLIITYPVKYETSSIRNNYNISVAFPEDTLTDVVSAGVHYTPLPIYYYNYIPTSIDSAVVVWWDSLVTSVGNIQTKTPAEFVLQQNYPNPFNPTTTISFSLPSKSFVSLKVFDALGREVATLVSEELSAGDHSRQWNAEGSPSGVYFCRLHAGSFSETKKLLLLR